MACYKKIKSLALAVVHVNKSFINVFCTYTLTHDGTSCQSTEEYMPAKRDFFLQLGNFFKDL